MQSIFIADDNKFFLASAIPKEILDLNFLLSATQWLGFRHQNRLRFLSFRTVEILYFFRPSFSLEGNRYGKDGRALIYRVSCYRGISHVCFPFIRRHFMHLESSESNGNFKEMEDQCNL
ncbi:hypothetical protein TNIN_266181 [Trichonephila inaurata madagascariensis]|uniref:Uncharacterized protein n=1 Tax=Trichonephila inaurata madagascariensis TaxID=2747483 RepID=A0A8X6IBM0_9ARAC|nr:hypothetical protein TNIN_266181 [Trichonephila inaurata madagascariensis]